MAYRDNKNVLDAARDEGKAEGEAKGEAKGKTEVAQNLKRMGLKPVDIAQDDRFVRRRD